MGRRRFPIEKVLEGVSSPGRKSGKASLPRGEGVGRD